jgi:hypothetical protein
MCSPSVYFLSTWIARQDAAASSTRGSRLNRRFQVLTSSSHHTVNAFTPQPTCDLPFTRTKDDLCLETVLNMPHGISDCRSVSGNYGLGLRRSRLESRQDDWNCSDHYDVQNRPRAHDSYPPVFTGTLCSAEIKAALLPTGHCFRQIRLHVPEVVGLNFRCDYQYLQWVRFYRSKRRPFQET